MVLVFFSGEEGDPVLTFGRYIPPTSVLSLLSIIMDP
jgi:hypothetical protein